MRARTGQEKRIRICLPNQQPIRFNMAFPKPGPIAQQRVWSTGYWQGLPEQKALNDRAQFTQILAPPIGSPHIFSELTSRMELFFSLDVWD